MKHFRRNKVLKIKLWSAPGPLGTKVIRLVTVKKAEEMIEQGKAWMRYDGLGDWVGLQLCHPNQPTQIVIEESRVSSSVLSRAEVEALTDGIESRTASRSQAWRDAKAARGHRDMDLIEAARIKLEAFRPVFAW